MLVGPLRLSLLAALAAFGAIGAALAMWGAGVPYLFAALVAAALAGLVQYAAQRGTQAVPQPVPELAPTDADPQAAMREQLDAYRAHTAMLRHDLRGVLSPALMMSDRLLNHADPAVQRAGTAVVRSIERATSLLATSREMMATPASAGPAPADRPATAATTVQVTTTPVTTATDAPADPVSPPR